MADVTRIFSSHTDVRAGAWNIESPADRDSVQGTPRKLIPASLDPTRGLAPPEDNVGNGPTLSSGGAPAGVWDLVDGATSVPGMVWRRLFR